MATRNSDVPSKDNYKKWSLKKIAIVANAILFAILAVVAAIHIKPIAEDNEERRLATETRMQAEMVGVVYPTLYALYDTDGMSEEMLAAVERVREHYGLTGEAPDSDKFPAYCGRLEREEEGFGEVIVGVHYWGKTASACASAQAANNDKEPFIYSNHQSLCDVPTFFGFEASDDCGALLGNIEGYIIYPLFCLSAVPLTLVAIAAKGKPRNRSLAILIVVLSYLFWSMIVGYSLAALFEKIL